MVEAAERAALFDMLGRSADTRESALFLASAGVPVFLGVAGENRPAVNHGFRAATTDKAQAERWWGRWPNANFAAPTGFASGIDVIEVDRHEDNDGLIAFRRARGAGLLSEWGALIITPSGGLHLYFAADPDRPQQPWQAVSAHIDIRGDGGYALLLPSRVVQPDGSTDTYALSALGSASPVEATRLRRFLMPDYDAFIPRRPRLTRARDNFTKLADWVASQQEGERNACLYWAARQMAAASESIDTVPGILTHAVELAGLVWREFEATIHSAYNPRRTQAGVPRPQRALESNWGGSRSYRSSTSPGRVIA